MKQQRKRSHYPQAATSAPPLVAEPVSPSESYTSPAPKTRRSRRAVPRQTRAGAGAGRAPQPKRPMSRAERYRKAAALLREWMADDSGYDERIGALLEGELKKDPIRFREEFE
jgi:hypothetical protein